VGESIIGKLGGKGRKKKKGSIGRDNIYLRVFCLKTLLIGELGRLVGGY